MHQVLNIFSVALVQSRVPLLVIHKKVISDRYQIIAHGLAITGVCLVFFPASTFGSQGTPSEESEGRGADEHDGVTSGWSGAQDGGGGLGQDQSSPAEKAGGDGNGIQAD